MRGKPYHLIRALAVIAWADGVLRPGEADFFLGVLRGLDLTDETEKETLAAVLRPGSPDDILKVHYDEEDRRWVIGFGYLMAAADGEVCSEEMDALKQIGAEFDLEPGEVERILEEARTAMPALGGRDNE